MRNIDKGFSLIELSVVLVIIGILVALSLSLGTSQIQLSNINSTKSKLDRIDEAMILYYKVNRSLPCPANPTVDLANGNFGVGNKILSPTTPDPNAVNDATCPSVAGTYTILASSPASSIYFGVVPVRDLGISDDYMFDAWGDRLTYAVSKFCVDPDNWSANNRYKCAQNTDPTTNGNNVTLLDAAGTARPTLSAYIILSNGKNGFGGYNRKGTQNAVGSASALEVANAKTYTAPVDATFRDAFINDGTVAARYFDDIVRWKPAQLFDTDAAVVSTVACATATQPPINRYGTNSYYYPCAAPSGTVTGNDNYVFGTDAGTSITSANYNILIGAHAGTIVATTSGNIMMGRNAGKENYGTNNIIMGDDAGRNSSVGYENIIMGTSSGNNHIGAYNVALGYQSGRSTNGVYGVALGYQSGGYNSGFRNITLGYQSGYNSNNILGSGSDNVFIGSQSGYYNGAQGTDNVIIGRQSGWQNSVGSNNNFIGVGAGSKNTTGSENVFFGSGAGLNNTSGSYNTAIGAESGFSFPAILTLTGAGNIMLGTYAGQYINGTSAYNTFLGSYSGCSSAINCSTISNATAIGYNALVDTNNTVVIGNSSVTTVTVNGDLNIQSATPVSTNATSGSATINSGTTYGQPAGFVTIKINGAAKKIPYYN